MTILADSGAAPSSEKEWRIVIENDYQRDNKIWGTYGQTSEKTSLFKKKKHIAEKRRPVANMMLKDGQMVLIQPVSNEGITSYKVKKFPYKRAKGKKYNINLSDNKQHFLDLYKGQLLTILKKNKIDPNQIDWDSLDVDKMNCRSLKKRFNCKIPLTLKPRPSS